MNLHRYQLAPYRGPASRTTCPACGKAKTFVPYLDSKTGERLPEPYGRCNREANCGHHLSPYHVGPSEISYADDVRQREHTGWQGQRASMMPKRMFPVSQSLGRGNKETSKTALNIPEEVFTASLGHYDRNQFARLLRGHFGMGVAGELLARFQVGTSSALWQGATVFWYIDEQDRKRGGQVVLFDEDGHTARKVRPYGKELRCTSWVHTALSVQCERKGQPHPEWLTTYNEQAEKSPCMFGLPQLRTAPPTQPVAVVEAPKTAVLCTPYFPQFVWLAVGALSYLNADRMAPLRGRNVVMFPDLSEGSKAFADWSRRAEQLRREGFSVTVSDYLETRATDEQRAAGYDLADFLLEGWGGYPPSWD
jgi:hypothetical protein